MPRTLEPSNAIYVLSAVEFFVAILAREPDFTRIFGGNPSIGGNDLTFRIFIKAFKSLVYF